MRAVISRALILVFAAAVTSGAQSQQPPEALDGVDTVVLLKTGKEVFGKSAHGLVHGRFTYLFSSPENKAEFERDPGKYAIQMNGLCARMGGTANGDGSNYAVVDGKIYTFASDACRTAFLAAPVKFIPKPRPPMPSSAEAVAKGRQLLDRAAAAHGGQALDALKGYAERHSVSAQGPPGTPPRVFAYRTLARFASPAIRQERQFTMQNGQSMTVVTVINGEAGWSGPVDRGMQPINPAAIPQLQHELGRSLVPLLRSRGAAGAQVAALGPATIGGTSVEQVRLRAGGLDVTLNIAASGKVHSIAFVGKNQRGEFGDYVVTFGDLRDTAGVLIPFAETATFDGAPDSLLARTIEAVEINPTLSDDLFTAAEAKR